MNRKSTHHALFATQFEVVAWQFKQTEPLPGWISKTFSFIERELRWMARANNNEVVYANTTDWAVVIEKSVVVLTNSEFGLLFKPL